jgi:hypothetical protein
LNIFLHDQIMNERDKHGSPPEISSREWGTFFERFTRDHKGWLVSVEGPTDNEGALAGGKELPLEAVAMSLDGRSPALSLTVNQPDVPHGHLMHAIEDVQWIGLQESQNGSAILHVRSANGAVTVVRFRPVAVPERVPDAGGSTKTFRAAKTR